jgi:hypothetical protein
MRTTSCDLLGLPPPEACGFGPGLRCGGIACASNNTRGDHRENVDASTARDDVAVNAATSALWRLSCDVARGGIAKRDRANARRVTARA